MCKYRITDAADWVIQRESASFEGLDRTSPSEFALVDYQDRISGEGIERYCHTVERINDESRLEDASLLIMELNDQQEMLLHHISLIRSDATIDALDPERIAVNERQRGLESHVVDGITTISYSIEDLRVGDVIDYAYTVVTRAGGHPVHGDYYLSNRWLTWNIPVKLQFVRLLNHAEQPVRWSIGRYADQSFTQEEGVIASGENHELALTDLPITQIDQMAPPWFWPDFMVLATDIDWIAVSREMFAQFRAMGIWEESLDLSGVVDIDTTDVEKAIIQLLRFVQNEVRYKSESSGIFSHTPKMASKTLAMRYGDCKDKATLLKLLLEQIGFAADLVLVNTELDKKIKSLPPSPLWFDHMILRIRHEGKAYFVDPTIKKQGGDLHHLADLPYACVLPLCEEGCDLLELPKHPLNPVFNLAHTLDFSHERTDHYYFGIQRTFYGHRADNMRYYLSSKSPELLADEFLNYARDDLNVGLESEIAIHIKNDDIENNRLETYEQYRIHGLDQADDNRTLEIRTDHVNSFPLTNSSEYPLKHELDGGKSHKIDVFYRLAGSETNENERINNKWFSYRDEVRATKNAYHFLTETVPGKSYVPAGDLQAYMNDVEAMRQRSINRFPFRTHQVDWMDRLGAKMWMIAFVILMIMLAIFNITKYQ
ncbi:MAG: DUF3857 domain-containing protein [Candidatus Thiodiazotropha sp. (ex Monitilora ramsayi)]|nr:DUF3857 domain-containing protein [Candidatus Thiodiazotropha sp. (ex Monitilora ramsayi)]